MDETDPETAALIRQLHREVNGLTRGRRGSVAQAPAEPPLKRRKGSVSSSVSPPTDLLRSHSRKGQSSSHLISDGPPRKPPATEGPAVRQLRRLQKQPSSTQSLQAARTDKEQDIRPDSKAVNVSRPKDSEDSSTGQQPAAAGAENPSLPPFGNLQAQHGWTEEQAFSAATEAVEKAKQAGRTPGRSRFKCFCNGLPWGLALPPEALRSRKSLADALEQGFDDEALRLEAGQRLHVILLDSEGQIFIYPPDMSDAPWAKLAPEVTRAYVCQA